MLDDTDTDRDDRRSSARSRLFMLVTIGRGPAADTMWAHDIGLGGMQCRSRSVRFVGTYLDLTFRLPGSDELLEVGAQVASLDTAPDGVTLGVRFCRLPDRAEIAIYRFLDRRRPLWDPKAVPPPARSRAALEQRPFEDLLLDAFAALRQKELRRPTFIASGPSRDLESLSRILGRSPSRRAG